MAQPHCCLQGRPASWMQMNSKNLKYSDYELTIHVMIILSDIQTHKQGNHF